MNVAPTPPPPPPLRDEHNRPFPEGCGGLIGMIAVFWGGLAAALVHFAG